MTDWRWLSFLKATGVFVRFRSYATTDLSFLSVILIMFIDKLMKAEQETAKTNDRLKKLQLKQKELE